jgi:hypothetical protein
LRVDQFFACLLGVFAAGCATDDPFANARPATPGEKSIILATARNELYDPFSIRNAELSKVVTVEGGGGRPTRRVVCVRYDSKTKSGAWTGQETHLVTITAGNTLMSSVVVPAGEMPCDRVEYGPFPEAQGMKRRG